MSNIVVIDSESQNQLLTALGEQLATRGAGMTLVVAGGSALVALGLTTRVTKDVDVVALVEGGRLRSALPFPDVLTDALRVVARDFGLADDWLNPGPASLLDHGLPEGLINRAQPAPTRRRSPSYSSPDTTRSISSSTPRSTRVPANTSTISWPSLPRAPSC